MIHHIMRYFSFKKTATAPVEAPVAMTLAYVDLDNFLGSLKHGYLISSAVQHIDSLMETLMRNNPAYQLKVYGNLDYWQITEKTITTNRGCIQFIHTPLIKEKGKTITDSCIMTDMYRERHMAASILLVTNDVDFLPMIRFIKKEHALTVITSKICNPILKAEYLESPTFETIFATQPGIYNLDNAKQVLIDEFKKKPSIQMPYLAAQMNLFNQDKWHGFHSFSAMLKHLLPTAEIKNNEVTFC